MAERRTIARPYAKALFELALAQKQLDDWSEALALAAAVVTDVRVRKLLTNPRVTVEELADLVIGVVGAKLNEEGRNFIRVLAANRRLGYLPEIAMLYEQLKASRENRIDVMITTAIDLEKPLKQVFQVALAAGLRRDVRLQFAVDRKLLGGAILRAGDLVIDGSLSGRLERLSAELTS